MSERLLFTFKRLHISATYTEILVMITIARVGLDMTRLR